MGFLAGKRLLITGLLNNRSIAYGIARACHREGAELAFSYVGERFKDRITEFAAEFGSKDFALFRAAHEMDIAYADTGSGFAGNLADFLAAMTGLAGAAADIAKLYGDSHDADLVSAAQVDAEFHDGPIAPQS